MLNNVHKSCKFVLIPILILTTAVVSVEHQFELPKAVVLQEVVEKRNDAVSTLSYVVPLVDKVIKL